MNKTLFIIFALTLSSFRSYQNTTHSFVYHGTDNLGIDNDFFYVRYGVYGESSTYYRYEGYDFMGGDVRTGLIADAKLDLIAQHPLEPNQMYANLSVDVMRTEQGFTDGQSVSLKEVTLAAVLTTDIIEYGTPPAGYKLPYSEQKGKIGTIENVDVDNLDSMIPVTSATDPISDALYNYDVGESVVITFRDEEIVGVVEKRFFTYGIAVYRVEFEFQGKTKAKPFYDEEITSLDTEKN